MPRVGQDNARRQGKDAGHEQADPSWYVPEQIGYREVDREDHADRGRNHEGGASQGDDGCEESKTPCMTLPRERGREILSGGGELDCHDTRNVDGCRWRDITADRDVSSFGLRQNAPG